MTSFVKGNSGLERADQAKIRNFVDACAAADALANGELGPNDLFTTVSAEGITEDIEAVINCLVSITPNTASPTNMLVTQADIGGGSVMDCIAALNTCTCCLRDDVDALTTNKADVSTVNQLGARVGVNETNITGLQTSKVSCTDYTTNCTCTNNRLTSLETNALTAANFSLSGTTLTITV